MDYESMCIINLVASPIAADAFNVAFALKNDRSRSWARVAVMLV